MTVVDVHASKDYTVFIDELSLDDIGGLARRVSGGDAALIVSDDNVAPRYLARTRASLETAGYPVSTFVFPAGEKSKTLSTFARAIDACAEAGLTRSSVVIALGGGVTGDIAGFVAASYMRGCRCIQVPTSLLACVDSSVGGKVGVDIPAGKNLVGAFFQPDAVLIDTSLLSTLDPVFFTDGCAEIIKYGAIRDAALFEELTSPLTPGDARLPDIIARCVALKRDVVEADERERGLRKLLNFGHTVGHAIESLTDFQVHHGFAVATGMAVVTRAAARSGLCALDTLERIERIEQAYGFDIETPLSPRALAEAMRADKKRTGDAIGFIVVDAIGTAAIREVPMNGIEAFLEGSCASIHQTFLTSKERSCHRA
ncbi:3-dehydroquinate synthase [Slackia exigua]